MLSFNAPCATQRVNVTLLDRLKSLFRLVYFYRVDFFIRFSLLDISRGVYNILIKT